MATAGAERGLQVVIVSGDKDFYQLVAPRVALLNPGRGGPAAVDESWVDEGNASDRLGVAPKRVVDFLALVGDSSDNIPGVKGIGEKGAQKLLAEFGDLETLLARAGEVTAKRAREALLTQADSARLSRELVTIKRDVPVELDAGALVPHEPDRDAVIRLLTELEFYSLARKLTGQGGGAAVEQSVAASVASAEEAEPSLDFGDASLATLTEEEGESTFSAESWLTLSDLSGPSVATVTVVDDPARPAGAGGAAACGSDRRTRYGELVLRAAQWGAGRALAGCWTGRSLVSALRPPAQRWGARGADPGAEPTAAYRPGFGTPVLAPHRPGGTQGRARHQVRLAGPATGRRRARRGERTIPCLASFVLDPGRRSHAIDTLCLEHLGRAMQTYQELAGKGKSEIPFAEVAIPLAANYCGVDSATVLALHRFFGPMLAEMNLEALLRDIEMPLVEVLADMEWEGITIDRAVFRRLSDELGKDLRRLEQEIARVAGTDLNLNSPRQLASILFEKQQLPVLKRTKTGPSTDADVLEQLAAMGHELPRLILEYRELQKLKSTYVDTLPQRINRSTGRIHTSFNQAGAATGRLSSAEPNLQNIPIRTPRGEAIRAGFVPRDGWVFLVADYSQIELRIMAHLSEDPAFIEAFRQGGDIHRQTAALIFNVPLAEVTGEMRARAKTINFATIYGQGPFALSRQLGISQDDAKGFIARYFERFSGVRAFLDRQIELARQQGYVETLFKRRRYIPEIKDRNFNQRAYGERNAQNSPLQGSAADLIKLAMVRIHRAIRERWVGQPDASPGARRAGLRGAA